MCEWSLLGWNLCSDEKLVEVTGELYRTMGLGGLVVVIVVGAVMLRLGAWLAASADTAVASSGVPVGVPAVPPERSLAVDMLDLLSRAPASCLEALTSLESLQELDAKIVKKEAEVVKVKAEVARGVTVADRDLDYCQAGLAKLQEQWSAAQDASTKSRAKYTATKHYEQFVELSSQYMDEHGDKEDDTVFGPYRTLLAAS